MTTSRQPLGHHRALVPLLALALSTLPASATPTAEQIAASPQLDTTLPASTAATSPSNPLWRWSAAAGGLVEIVLQLSSSSTPPTAFHVYTDDDTPIALRLRATNITPKTNKPATSSSGTLTASTSIGGESTPASVMFAAPTDDNKKCAELPEIDVVCNSVTFTSERSVPGPTTSEIASNSGPTE